MIFAIAGHIKLIIEGKKTETRRASDRYQVGKTYSIQPARNSKGIKEGRIMILKKTKEGYSDVISEQDAEAEGGYTPEEFEGLYEELYPEWFRRWAYTFRFCPSINK